MAGSIGKASLTLTASAARLNSGLDAAYTKITQFKSKVTGSFTTLAAGGGPLALLTGGAKLFGDALGSIKELSEVGRQAKSLGIASDEFMGLSANMARFGVEGEAATKLFAKLGAKAAEAVGGNKGLAAEFSRLGISTAELKTLTPDQLVKRVADGIKGLGGSGAQAGAAMKLFEEEGLKILPMLQGGGAGIDAFTAKAKGMGTALSEPQMAAIERARSALPKIEAAFTGVWNRVVVAMAPVIETVANVATQILNYLSPAFDFAAQAAEAYYAVIGPAVGELIDGIAGIVAGVRDWVAESLGLSGIWPSVGEAVTATLRFIGKAGGYVWDTLKAGAGAVVYAVSYLVDAFAGLVGVFGSLVELAKDLPDELRPDWLDDLAAGVDQFKGKVSGAAEGMRGWGRDQIGAFGQSAARVDAWFDRLGQKKKEVEQIKPEVKPAGGGSPAAAAKSMDALLAGSKGELETRIRFESGNLGVQQQQLAEQRQANNKLGAIGGKLDALNGKVGGKLLTV